MLRVRVLFVIITVKVCARGREWNQVSKRNPLSNDTVGNYNGPATPISIDVGDRIINGDDTTIKEHPWAVYMEATEQSGAAYRCGASIVSATTIVTAAHCLASFVSGEGFYGEEDKNKFKKSFKFSKSDTVVHPDSDIDIGLIVLSDYLDFGGDAGKILLPSSGYKPEEGQEVTVIGWGKAGERQNEDPNTLQELEIPVQDSRVCGAGETYFCAGGEDDGKPYDACSGDSGGAVECTGSNGGVYLCGVVSSGPAPPRCGYDPGTYVNVGSSSVVNFIYSSGNSFESSGDRHSGADCLTDTLMKRIALMTAVFSIYDLF